MKASEYPATSATQRDSPWHPMSRRDLLRRAAFLGGGLTIPNRLFSDSPQAAAPNKVARIAITLDLEMSRNFPEWDDTHWDYEKGNLNESAKNYAVAAGQRVRQRGGTIHYFCVGRTLEQADIAWLRGLAETGHPIGNHTYDHVNVLADEPSQLQFRFQRAPWLIEGRSPAEVIRENIRLTTAAMRERLEVDNRGFRTPGGFHTGLHGREDLQQLLLDCGFTWVSSLYPAHANSRPSERPSETVYDSIVGAQVAAQPSVYPSGLIEIPMSPISDIGAFRGGRWKLDWYLEAIRRAVSWTIDHAAVFDFLAHPSCLGVVDPDFRTIDLICDLVEQAGPKAKLVDLDQLASELG